jgi:hypothetical protein
MITVYPKHIGLKYWAATVLTDYNNEPLPILKDEDKWAEWAKVVAGTDSFLNAGVPSPFKSDDNSDDDNLQYKDWEEWAKIVYNIMNSKVN